ncbi:Alpha-1,2-mannosyltransferase MNN23 [Fulvia fulva]|uniref:Alpha-1,2-mannosyltransferase MNN23 n=1 Tax=Passalora fulva TaxID=5499 RepID=A0A9Q8LGG5_PASFU|nr:Alpha-1,2-mannosyltransferase MNN23 [Fulvia fulva]KAK4627118.1 Alpha-1,2-mannosyltransferase MNN23 [Fulvia fulva]KAK4628165.1 Alpha-1,2-mannosyltransferase MNN23 [Fulvia fulva]UJO16953.1 Alpha-1,2-mannosyltransferase MNN23 [Fulvia fulva]WPV13455.1 Alpha-1,2-mannosyltransferase MNN23 [Fulvia fulva]WPV29219.1 Alpha-1,2-mannosyltransferase MNN23 [Fulvia fulva]
MLRLRPLITLLVASICVLGLWTLWHGSLGQEPTPLTPAQYKASGLTDNIYTNGNTKPDADDWWLHFEEVLKLKPVSMKEAKAGCAWNPQDLERVNFQFDGGENGFVDTAWVRNDTSDLVLDARRAQWQDFMMYGTIPYGDISSKLDGRGIVIVGGQSQSFHRVKVLLRQLKRLGSSIPVELHYWGDEMNEEKKQELSTLWPLITYNDLSSPTNIYHVQLGGIVHVNYQLKTAAILNSNFAEILLMDSDNIPTIPPEDLFNSKTYKEHGTVFWPDIARTRVQNPVWPITNTPCRKDEYEQESGQALIDKRKFWYHLQLAMFFINDKNSEYYNNILLGDKDTFRFAWHALKTTYGRPAHWLATVGIKMAPDHFCGHHFAQFHPDREDGRVVFMHGGLLKTMDKQVMTFLRASHGGIFHAYKTGTKPYDAEELTRAEIKFDGASYWKHKPESVGVQMCTDMKDVEARPFGELVQGFNEVFEEVGGYWLIDSGEFSSGT